MSSILTKISLVNGDITKLTIEAIVNAANSSLLGGGGVDGAIHKAAGPELLEECKTLDGCKVGESKITNAYDIETVIAIIHTVGPQIYGDVTDEDQGQLACCYRNSLDLARENNLRSIAFPCISTGIYHFPKNEASKIALKTVKDWLTEDQNNSAIEKIVFCVFNDEDKKWYEEFIPEILD